MKTNIFSIQRFCTHDGPGVRTTVFFAGCPLSCLWCHNPEGKTGRMQMLFHAERCIGCGRCLGTDCGAQIFEPERNIDRKKCSACGRCLPLCPSGALEGTVRTVGTEEILSAVMSDSAFYGEDGGMTLSGGEPMLQPEAALELLRGAKAAGIGTALETCGVFDPRFLPELVQTVDTFLWDYKDSDPDRFRGNTGGDLRKIEENLRTADSLGANIRLRCILIHGCNTEKEHAEAVRRLASSLRGLSGIDLISYHPMGESKYRQLGIEDSYDSEEKIPTPEDKALFREILADYIKNP